MWKTDFKKIFLVHSWIPWPRCTCLYLILDWINISLHWIGIKFYISFLSQALTVFRVVVGGEFWFTHSQWWEMKDFPSDFNSPTHEMYIGEEIRLIQYDIIFLSTFILIARVFISYTGFSVRECCLWIWILGELAVVFLILLEKGWT